MSKSFTAQIDAWSEKAKRNIDLVMKQSTTDVVAEMTTPQKSVKETGGSFEIGKVAVDDSVLINSLVVDVNGSRASEGKDGYTFAIAGMKMGDTVHAGFTAAHARAHEYGTKHTQGRFFRREAALKWTSIVDANARKLTD